MVDLFLTFNCFPRVVILCKAFTKYFPLILPTLKFSLTKNLNCKVLPGEVIGLIVYGEVLRQGLPGEVIGLIVYGEVFNCV